MGSVELTSTEFLITSHIITYGNAADANITESIREEIETMWNEPRVFLHAGGNSRQVRFRISASHGPALQPRDILENTDPRNNYFRIEPYAHGNISFVDGLGSNTGYFKMENLYKGSTTAAHEYGHTIGLDHPKHIDLRGKGTPGIMYPRGTLVDPQFQYNTEAIAGDNTNGGTMHPKYRRVQPADILHLGLLRLNFQNNRANLGNFSSIWHEAHQAN